VSWAAHELESYVIQKHVRVKVSFLAVLAGCLLPDQFTKLPVYGFSVGDVHVKAAVPWHYHRSFPGVGFTHSLLFCALVATIMLAVTRNRPWFLGLLIGSWAHVFTDCFDSVGTMLFFPFTTRNYSVGMWAYASQEGRYGDAAAYYSSLGGVWDFLWLVLVLTSVSVLGKRYFFTTIVPADPAWGWLRRKFRLSDRAMLALYRAFFVYGACRIFAWFIWARFIDHAPMDWRWGGPWWVDKVDLPAIHPWEWVVDTTIGVAGTAFVLWLGWRLIGRRLWNRAAAAEERSPYYRQFAPVQQDTHRTDPDPATS